MRSCQSLRRNEAGSFASLQQELASPGHADPGPRSREAQAIPREQVSPIVAYKTVQALRNEAPPVKEISVTMSIRITLQEFDDHIYLRNIGGHDILP